MLYSYITTATTTQVYAPPSNQGIREILIQVNKALTGTIGVVDGTTGTTANVATITNPATGDEYIYRGLQNGVRIVTSATCDITVSCDLSFAGR